jgi:hypothetical protein
MSIKNKIDFKNHVMTITKNGDITVVDFKKPDTNVYGITLIIGRGVTAVTGDLGNWIIGRELYPSTSGEKISRDYMDSKVKYASEQVTQKYSPAETLKQLKQFQKSFKSDYGRPMDEEEKHWIKTLKELVEDEEDYRVFAYRDCPAMIEFEDVPIGFVRPVWLDFIYDAYDAMAKQIQALNRKQVKTLLDQDNPEDAVFN